MNKFRSEIRSSYPAITPGMSVNWRVKRESHLPEDGYWSADDIKWVCDSRSTQWPRRTFLKKKTFMFLVADCFHIFPPDQGLILPTGLLDCWSNENLPFPSKGQASTFRKVSILTTYSFSHPSTSTKGLERDQLDHYMPQNTVHPHQVIGSSQGGSQKFSDKCYCALPSAALALWHD